MKALLLSSLLLISCGNEKYQLTKTKIHVVCFDGDEILYDDWADNIVKKGPTWIITNDSLMVSLKGECIKK